MCMCILGGDDYWKGNKIWGNILSQYLINFLIFKIIILAFILILLTFGV